MPLNNGKPGNRESNGDFRALRDCKAGETVTIRSVSYDLSCGQRLRELGIVEGSRVRLLKRTDPLLILVKQSRIAIDPATASMIGVDQATSSNGDLRNKIG